MGRVLGIVLVGVVGAATTAQADMVKYTFGGVTSTVAVFGDTWASATTGDPWELSLVFDTTIPEDNSTQLNPDAHRYFGALIDAVLTLDGVSSPITVFSDDLIFENQGRDTLFFAGLTSGGTVTVSVDGPPFLFDRSDFPDSVDMVAAMNTTIDINLYIPSEVGLIGSTLGGTFAAQVIPSPTAPLALLAGLGLIARRRR